mgnify:CR=1 FL=1
MRLFAAVFLLFVALSLFAAGFFFSNLTGTEQTFSYLQNSINATATILTAENVSFLRLTIYSVVPTNITVEVNGTVVGKNITIPGNVTLYLQLPFNVSLNKTYAVLVGTSSSSINSTAKVLNVSLTYLKGVIDVYVSAVELNETTFYSITNYGPYPVILVTLNETINPLQTVIGNVTFSNVTFLFKSENGSTEEFS